MSAFQIKLLTDITVEPVTLAEIKAWSQIDSDYSAEDTMLEIIRKSAREKLEGALNVYFGVKTVEAQFSGSVFNLPYGPTGTILSFFNVGSDPYADIEYTLHGLTFKTMCIGVADSVEWFYPMGSSYPTPWQWTDFNYNTYNVIYTTGYQTLPTLLKEALLIQIDWDLKMRGVPDRADLCPNAIQRAQRFNRNFII